MAYVEGFLLAVPTADKELYRKYAAAGWPLFADFGVLRLVEGWGDDVPDGKVTDFKRAVNLKPDETVLFSWFEFESKEDRIACHRNVTADPRFEKMGDMPFDGMRMVYGAFSVMVDEGPGGKPGHIDGYVLAVPKANKEAYRDMAMKAAAVFLDHGATRVVETWEDDVQDGKVTDFRRAVKATQDEAIVFSWVEWPSKEAREAGWPKLMEYERMKYDPATMPFDGQRMIYGTFSPIVDEAAKVANRKTA
ncbi:MAG: DUF1428 domain-containing protein [Alphaproteobacteria bacterium]|nr:DUF1428 domain-containing protein [Alphaproteobacteria bacterium]MDX5415010.1 DUF1428 domain-containing protein [Alphaproteobacteria bacterium]MDX5492195.1 DUF1428 domain-containing protein [Alphaproteobacteria bacterium]